MTFTVIFFDVAKLAPSPPNEIVNLGVALVGGSSEQIASPFEFEMVGQCLPSRGEVHGRADGYIAGIRFGSGDRDGGFHGR